MAEIFAAHPLFASADIPASARWYSDKLHFKVQLERPDYAVLARDGIEIHLWPCADRKIAENTSAYFRTDDLEALHASFAGAADGGRISPVADKEWGMREFYVWDPDGNLLRFGVPSLQPNVA